MVGGASRWHHACGRRYRDASVRRLLPLSDAVKVRPLKACGTGATFDSTYARCYNDRMSATLSPEKLPSRVSPSMTAEQISAQRTRERQMRAVVLTAILGALVFLVLLGLAVFALMQPGTPTDRIRDIFIIVVSFETLVIGVALIVLLIQLASLINLLQNEVRPMLNAASETINTLRGTADFLGE